MPDIVTPILQWLNAHPNLAGLGTFVISAAESIAIIGTIIPGSVMMTAIGALAGAGVIPLYETIIWAMLGAIVGDGISYKIGYHFKDRLHYVWPFRNRPGLLIKGEVFFQKYGSMSVFIGRFVGPVRAMVPLVAGMLGMKPLKFYVANVLSAIGWAPAYMLPGILLGAASLELPPDIAVHAMLVILLVTLFVILCIWLIYKFFVLINSQVNNLLNSIWLRLGRSKYFHSLTTILRHYDPNKTHGQLTLALYFIIVSALFVLLACYVKHHGSQAIFINNSVYYFFRSLRTTTSDHIMLAITLLGEKVVLLPLSLTLFVWLGFKKRWWTAWHILALGVLAALGTEIIKHWIHSPRPWGIFQSPMSSSFPSGHTVLATVFYVGMGLLLIKAYQIKRSLYLYRFFLFLVLLVSISRLYLGAHWFTDVLGGWLFGAAILSFVVLSYNRRQELPLAPKGIFITIFATLLFTYTAIYLHKIKQEQFQYEQIDWPQYTVSLQSWWEQKGNLPHYRVNRFGFSDEILNLQWLGDLPKINAILLQNGWEIPPERDWIGILHRLSDIQSAEHVPLVSPLFQDQKPDLVLIKHVNGKRRLVILRLWDSRVKIQDATDTLWVGTVTQVPRTYSWILMRKKPFELTQTVLFNKTPPGFEIKTMQVKTKQKKNVPILFIKPK